MATQTIGSVGARLDLLIKQGSTFQPEQLIAKNPDGSRVDLTGAVIRAQIRKAASGPLVKAFTITYIDRVNGVFTLGLTATETSAIKSADDPNSGENRYVWDLEMDMAGVVTPLAWGEVKMFREVTR
jgi:hypothetical protein